MAGRASVPTFSNARYALDVATMTEALSNA